MKLTNSITMGCIALASLTAVSIFSGCKKSNDGSGSNGISATIGSTSYQSTFTQGLTGSGDSFISLVGLKVVSGDTLAIEIDIADTATVNYTDINFSGSSVTYSDYKSGKIYSADGFYGSGAFKLTSWDKTNHKIAGTFSGVLQNTNDGNDSLVVKNGQFNTSYIVLP